MADPITLTIDGVKISMPKGTLIVDAAKRMGNDIPVFCYHPKLPPVGMCRMCLVEVGTPKIDPATKQPALDDKGEPVIAWMPKLQTACTTPISEGMIVRGATPQVTAARNEILEFLLTSHPLDCPICDKGGECPLQNLTMRHGPGQSRFIYDEKQHLDKHIPLGDPGNALIFLDRERCIQCARCTRFADEIAGDHVIGFYERGRKLEIVTFSAPGFDSKFSGNTTDICPVGALTTADFRFRARPWEMQAAASICPHCPVGCNLTLNVRRNTQTGGWDVKRVMPRQNEAVNETWICDKGRFGHHFATSPDRLTAPLVRKIGKLEPATWDEALNLVADKLKAASGSIVGLAGERLSNEDLYNFRVLLTGLGGSAEAYGTMGGGDLVQQVGVGVGTNFSAMGRGTVILVAASDLEEEAPIWWLRVKQAAERGATLITVNGRATKTDRYAAHCIRHDYGSETATVLGILAKAAPDGEMKSKAARYASNDPAIAAAASAIGAAENVVVMFGNEGLDFASSTALAQACANLLIATAHFGRPNNGLMAVWPHNNTQGARDMGLQPSGVTMVESLWSARVLLFAGCDPAGDAVGPEIGRAIHEADFVVVQELFLTPTAQLADVVLPAQSFVEREGSYTSGERRVQRFYPAVPARGGAKADWQISAEIAKRVAVVLPTASAAAVMLAIAKSVPAYQGITYQALAKVERQWPDVGGVDLYYGGTAYDNSQGLGVQVKSSAERGERPAPRWIDPPAPPIGDGFKIVPTTALYDRGTTFVPSALMQPRVPKACVELNAADAARLGIADGDTVKVSLNGHSAPVTARVAAHGRAPEGVALMSRSLGVTAKAGAFVAKIEKA
ncbi:MAG: NADH-quinone oxidoreductase subunit NuoG [Chloroflexi bacterium]|nr:NADH-quinone oxidoreductase subunit NuoG [Chloroflexota bacterium]